MARVSDSLVVAAILVAAAGCSNFGERHFFKSTDEAGQAVNHYRVTVSGYTFLSSSRYVSGYYDESILDSYFNTMSQPTDAAVVPVAKTTKDGEGEGGGASGKVKTEPLTEDSRRKLVLLLSTNSDQIAQGLGALARSNEVASALGNLVGSGQFADASDAADRADLGTARGGVVANEAARVLEAAKEGAQPATKDQMLMLANDLATLIAPHQPFKTLDDAQTWLLDNAGGRQ